MIIAAIVNSIWKCDQSKMKRLFNNIVFNNIVPLGENIGGGDLAQSSSW